MTIVQFKFGTDQADGTVTDAGGNITCVPSRSRVIESSPDIIVLPKPFTVPFSGAVDIPLETSGLDWCWKIEITVTGVTSLVEYVSVPDVETIDYADLSKIDPETMQPTDEPDALWWAKLNELIALGGIPGEPGEPGRDGIDGINGTNGRDGANGTNGTSGVDGIDGKSAYDLATAFGFSGTLTEWLESLNGTDGINGINGTNGTNGVDGIGLPATSTALNIVRRNAGNTAYETVNPDDAMPLRLAKFATQVTDWNLAVTNGWFYSVSGAANSPTTGNFIAQVIATGTAVTQFLWAYTSDTELDTKSYRRDYTGSVWSAPSKMLMTRAELDLRYAQIGRDTPMGFGAVGDGVADDTTAVQAWAASTHLNKNLGGKIYRTTANIVCTVDNVRILGPGTIKGDTIGVDVLTVSGVKSKVQSITVDGSNKCRYGIYNTGAASVINDNDVSNCYSTTNSPRGIYSTTTGGVFITNNRIANINAPGNSTQGDSNGLSRGIVAHAAATPTAPTVISGNTIDGILGEEADGIAILYSDTIVTTYLSGYTYIGGNQIRNCGRRYIKLQGSNIWVDRNWCWATPAHSPVNPSNIIDVIQGSNIDITGNRVEEMLMLSPVSIDGASTERITGIRVRNNFLSEGDGTNPVVYVSNADNVEVTHNTLSGGSYFVNAGTSNELVVGFNTCRGGNASNPAFSFTGTAYGKVGHNSLPTGRTTGTATNVVFTGNW